MKDYFGWFDLEESFDIDSGILKTRFYQKSMQVHPDKEGGSLELSSFNNEAYKTLRDQPHRLRYLLEKYSRENRSDKLPPMFLMEMMEINEAISEMNADTETKVMNSLRNEIAELKSSERKKVQGIFHQTPSETTNEDWEKIAEYLLKLKYFDRLADRIS